MSDMGAAVPGTGDGDPGNPGSSSTDVNPDGQGTPDTVPYNRFKEVNDALKPFKEIEGLGYDVDSLRRLIEWESRFSMDPTGNWLNVAKDLNLPPEVKEAVQRHLEGNRTAQPGSSTQGE